MSALLALRRRGILLLAVVGCADEPAPDPHDDVECAPNKSWRHNGASVRPDTCDYACRDMPAEAEIVPGGPCDDPNNTCPTVFTSESGLVGCCEVRKANSLPDRWFVLFDRCVGQEG